MQKYNITLHAIVNVRIAAVEVPTQQKAIEAVLDRVDLYSLLERTQPTPKVQFTSYAEEIPCVLVDKVGDKKYAKSRWFIWEADQWIPEPRDHPEKLLLLDHQANAIRKKIGLFQTRRDNLAGEVGLE